MTTRADIVAAAKRIRGRVHRTPVLTNPVIDQELGAEFHFKCENLQRAGSFKIRGATNVVQSLPERVRAVATHSSGNHGAALALAAAEADLECIVVAPMDIRPTKRAAIERYGAQIVPCQPSLIARETTLNAVVYEYRATFVPPYDAPRIIAGAGTAALELMEECPDLDQVWVPVGGGGLAAGTALTLGRRRGAPKAMLAEPELAGDAKLSLETGEVVPALPPRTVADGLRTSLGARNFAILQRAGCSVHLASEDAILDWTERVSALMGFVIEPSAAVPLAAMAEHPGVAQGKVGVILSGGNL